MSFFVRFQIVILFRLACVDICWERAVLLAVRLCCFSKRRPGRYCSFPLLGPGQDVVFDCICSLSLPFHLLCNYSKEGGWNISYLAPIWFVFLWFITVWQTIWFLPLTNIPKIDLRAEFKKVCSNEKTYRAEPLIFVQLYYLFSQNISLFLNLFLCILLNCRRQLEWKCYYILS